MINILCLRLFSISIRHHALSASSHHIPIRLNATDFIANEQQQRPTSHSPVQKWTGNLSHGASQPIIGISTTSENNNVSKFVAPMAAMESLQPLGLAPATKDGKELPTPTSTPTTSRKSRRRSNLFIPSSKKADDKLKNGELGSGRSIPIKQGYLYKRSSNSLNKEWKKKYVTLCDDGRLTYHPSLHDYMDDVHSKEVALQCVTVKIPGQKPRGSKSIITNSALTSSMNLNWKGAGSGLIEGIGGLGLTKDKKVTEKVLLTAFDTLREPGKSNSQTSGDEGIVLSISNSQNFQPSDSKNESQSNVKKRHRRMKSSGVKNSELDGKCCIYFQSNLRKFYLYC